jgi:hypothetical protein
MRSLLKLQLNLLLLGVATSAYVHTRIIKRFILAWRYKCQSARSQIVLDYALCSYLNFAKNHPLPRSWQEYSFHLSDLQQITVEQYQLLQTLNCIPNNHTVTKK